MVGFGVGADHAGKHQFGVYIYAKWMVFASPGPAFGPKACKNHPFGVYIYAKLMVSGVVLPHPKTINLAYIYTPD